METSSKGYIRNLAVLYRAADGGRFGRFGHETVIYP